MQYPQEVGGHGDADKNPVLVFGQRPGLRPWHLR